MKLMNRISDCSLSPHLSAICRRTLLIVPVCACALSFWPYPAISANNDTVAENSPVSSLTAVPFEYKLENRPDPFVPFISEKAASPSVNMDEIVDPTGPLTGMQLFEPGQLTLVGLVKKGGENLAMVEDFTGKGYVLTEGTKIGRRGVVKDIAPQSVLIEETAVTRAGKKNVTEIVMLLKKDKKEGEK
jgi:type IV pilus assembly protein PilP